MTTLARNHPCPCGSGKKYKLCCLGRQEAVDREARQARLRARIQAAREPAYRIVTDDPLDNLSNHANELIQKGLLDEAERACRQLMEQFPDYVDGLERTAELHEARGDTRAAAAAWRKALAMAQGQDGFEEESFQWMREQITRLEAKTPSPS